MPRTRIQLASSEDFTGGLNFRADPFQLEKNESPDLMNVDVDPRGGVALRKTFQQMNTTVVAGGGIISIFPYSTSAGTNQILIKAGDGAVRYSTGGNFTSAGFSHTTNHGSAVTFKDLLYLQDGVSAPVRWNGATSASLGSSFNDNIAAPTGGNMPIAKHIASHQGMVFVGNTVESGTPFRNRIRWSHPNFPEDWRTLDWIDVDIGREGDEIMALVPFGDRLLIFKRNSIHALYGYSRETFNVQPVTQAVGCVGPKAVIGTEHAVYFFAWPQGVFSYDGRRINWLFERLYPGILDGDISSSNAGKIAMGWGNRRLWVSTPWGNPTNNRTFVYDPTLGKTGSWVQYDKGFSAFFEWRPPGVQQIFVGGHPTAGWVNRLDQEGAQDNIDGTPTDIVSWYVTAWHDLGEYSRLKRWKRPELVLLSDVSARLRGEVFHDYDPATIHNTFEMETILEHSGAQWGSAVWGVDQWSRSNSSGHNRVVKGASLGLARSVQLKITGPVNPSRVWRINSLTFKFVPRRVRS